MAILPLRVGASRPQDGGLLDRIRASDPAALNAAMQAEWDGVIRYATGLARDPDEAEDAVQEAFMRLWERRRRWKSSESLRGLLFRMVRNDLLNRGRSRRRRGRLLERGGGGPARAPHTPLELAEESELARAAGEAIARLPERRREAFLLVRHGGLSYREAAEVMGISPQTFANQMSAALAALRDALRTYLVDASEDSPARLVLSHVDGRRSASSR